MGKDNKPASDTQDKIMREYMKKEMIKKIERRIDNQDDNVYKTIKSFLDEDKKKK